MWTAILNHVTSSRDSLMLAVRWHTECLSWLNDLVLGPFNSVLGQNDSKTRDLEHGKKRMRGKKEDNGPPWPHIFARGLA